MGSEAFTMTEAKCVICHQPIVASTGDPASHVGCCMADMGDCCSAAKPEIDAERLARAIEAHAASHKRHSRTHVRSTCAESIAAEYERARP